MSISFQTPRPQASTPTRRVIHRGIHVLIEETSLTNGLHAYPPAGAVQLVLTLQGMTEVASSSRSALVDANQALLMHPSQSGSIRYSGAGSSQHAALVVTIQGTEARASSPDGTSIHNVCPSICLAAAALGCMRSPDPEAEAKQLARDIAQKPLLRTAPPRVVDAARHLMHAHGGQRCTLAEVAQRVGVTPSYLTQEFTRSLGMPLYQYQLRLRMARALLDLPSCGDITELALALGFSSHSHFSAAFKAYFGMTPSAFRERPLHLAHRSPALS